MTPAPYFFPLPEPVSSPVEGTYVKIDSSWPQWWHCRRCADYRPAGGIWKLQFDESVMRIYYDVTGWRSFASFTVSGDELQVFNDAYCPETMGRYAWGLEPGRLALHVIEDSCLFGLRGENLSKQTWATCDVEPTDGQGENPPGCVDQPLTASAEVPVDLPFAVTALAGDSHHFERPPDVYAAANSEDISAPEGIRVSYHPESIPFGVNRVLWWGGDWLEATTEMDFYAMGIQFWGAPHTGWARILFDDVEVWRGIPARLGFEQLQYGGYVEVSELGPGPHTLRVESLGIDYRPLTVASFGFSDDAAVEK